MKETLGHYRIVRRLGAGGMGEVYLAEDTRLHRLVALKVLTPEFAREPRRVQRFLREAHAASALNHPNIAVIHEIGESDDGIPFIAMEYVEGQTLAEAIANKPLELKRIIELGLEIADALDEAQSKGVVHRDLKPSNIMINTRGHAKVLDFGLAKITEEAADAAASTDLKSDPDVVLGTVHYMSPEQALGKPVDPRSDLFTFGVILYEMATAKHPFGSGSATAIIERIVHQQPDSVARLNYDVPPDLERIIRKCLEKDREWRYQSAREIVVDLKSLRRDSESGERSRTEKPAEAAGPRAKSRAATLRTAAIVAVTVLVIGAIAVWGLRREKSSGTSPAAVTSIAVLPFSSLTANPALDHLRFALPDEVTTILSYNPSIALRPFSSTRVLPDSDPIQAGRTLKVEKVITGHYRSEHGGLGVTLEAIDVASNRVVWRNNIEVPSSELIALRNALSTQMRGGLLPALGVSEQSRDSSQPTNSEAYRLYLQSLSASSDVGPSREARALLERAVALDPNYASIWAELARRHYFEGNYGDGGKESVAAARAAARRALALDPELVYPRRSLVIYDAESGDIASAHRQALDLVRRRPRSADAHFVLGYTLRYAGRLQDAARQCETAYAIDPSAGLRSCAITYLHLGNYARARDFTRLDEGTQWSQGLELSMLIREKRIAEAQALVPQFRGRGPWGEARAQCFSQRPVDPKELDALEQRSLARVDSEPMYFDASEVAYFCGENQRALRILRKSLEMGYSIHPPIDTDPLFESLRKEPGFAELRVAAIRYRDRISAELAQIERSAK
jgi:serine/threonine protein kinase